MGVGRFFGLVGRVLQTICSDGARDAGGHAGRLPDAQDTADAALHTNADTSTWAQAGPPGKSGVWERMGEFRIWQEAAGLLFDNWKTGTCRLSESRLRRWFACCHRWDVRPFHLSVAQVIKCLTALLTRDGLTYSSINQVCSALSAVVFIDGWPIGQRHSTPFGVHDYEGLGVFSREAPALRYAQVR